MAFIIPSKLLETLTCDSCDKFLSVKPIKVFPNRRIKCGRCCRSKTHSGGVESLYNVVAEKCLFKCINRFDGCRTLLTYSQVREHEKVCPSNQYKCPICQDSKDIPTYLLIKHFRENHGSSILEHPGFSLNLDVSSESSVTYLYQRDDDLFFIILTSSQLEKNIKLKFLYLGDSKEAKNIYQQLTVSGDDKFDITLKPKPCSAYLSTDCDYLSINIPNAAHTIFIKFLITYKSETLTKLPEMINVITNKSETLTKLPKMINVITNKSETLTKLPEMMGEITDY